VPVPAREYGEWLGCYPWKLWTTLTFRHPPTTTNAMRAAGRVHRYLSGPSPAFHSPFCWFATESGALYGRVHLHALIGDLQLNAVDPYYSRYDVNRWWRKRYGIAHVRVYDPDRSASYYIAKYVTKGFGEWDAYGLWPNTLRDSVGHSDLGIRPRNSSSPAPKPVLGDSARPSRPPLDYSEAVAMQWDCLTRGTS